MATSWSIGEVVEVLDKSIGIYSPATIIQLDPIKVQYIGWGDEWNESIDDVSRIIPFPTNVSKCKCWVRFSDKLCWWPSVVFIRNPIIGSKAALEFLKTETRVFVKPCGNCAAMKQFQNGAWITTSKISPFFRNTTRRIRAGEESKLKSNFVDAVEELSSISDAVDHNFKFEGTYDKSFGLRKKRKLESATQCLDDIVQQSLQQFFEEDYKFSLNSYLCNYIHSADADFVLNDKFTASVKRGRKLTIPNRKDFSVS